jgi:uncharacterized protein
MTRESDSPVNGDTRRASRGGAALMLLLLVPVPTISVIVAMWHEATAGTAVGEGVYLAGKVWIAALPLIWLLFVERGRLSWSPPRRGGFGFGVASGLAISAAIVLTWFVLGDALIDRQTVRDAAEAAGFDEPMRFVLLAVYLCTINALIEEYVWRWFCFRQCERLTGAWGGGAAVILSAMFFTLHHILVLAALFGSAVTIIGSIGVFVGGCVWSYCYLRYRSIWPGFVSHVIVDVAILAIGWVMIFG